MSDVLIAHSLAEAYLYLMATPCAQCGKGPLKGADARRLTENDGPSVTDVAIRATCKVCGLSSDFQFNLAQRVDAENVDAPPVVNVSDAPSKIIDVAQWITLFRVLTQAAASQGDKQETRLLGLEAAQCLDEALKFYDDPDNDLPPPDAFFLDSSRARFDGHPEQFSRQRLIDLRAKLPTTATMRARLAKTDATRKGPRRWWRFWK